MVSIFESTEKAIRTSGLFFELSGVILVGWGFNKLRTKHGYPKLREIVMRWFKEVGSVFKKRTAVNINISAKTGAIGISGSESIVRGVGTNANLSIQGQINELRRELDVVTKKITAVEINLKSDIQYLRDETIQGIRELRNKFETLKKKLDELVFGDQYKEFLGLFWIAVGLTLATIPEVWEPLLT